MAKKVYLIDGNSFIYRMFFALPEFSTKDGKIVNAVFGMAKFFVGQLTKEKPDYIFFIKDAKGENFRHKLYTDYKATRDRMPDNLRTQIADIEKMIDLMGLDIIEVPGYEADDVIGTLAHNLDHREFEVDILTGDKDLYSLVSDNIKIYDTMKRKKFGPDETREKFGVDSKMIIDYLAIVGDKSDNIPGIDGFGPQKAVGLINEIGSVEEIYKKADEVSEGNMKFDDFDKSIQSCFKGKTFEKLLISRENAFLSKKLATLDKTVDLEKIEIKEKEDLNSEDIESYLFKPEEVLNEDVKVFFRELEFNSLISEDAPELRKWESLGLNVNIVGDKGGLDSLLKTIGKIKVNENGVKSICLDTETTSLNIMEAKLTGVSLYIDDKHMYYINRLHRGPKVGDKDLHVFLDYIFNMDITIVGHNLKYDLEILNLFMVDSKKYQEAPTSQMTLEL